MRKRRTKERGYGLKDTQGEDESMGERQKEEEEEAEAFKEADETI